MKRIFDILFSAVGISIVCIPMFLIWILNSIYLWQNGMFFQSRVGKDGRIFRIFKLTSLRDTQAGLKGFNSSFRKIFRYIKTDGFLYDLEFLLILEKKKINPKQISCTYYISQKSSITFNLSVYKKIFLDLLKIILNNFKKRYDLKKI